MTNTNMTRLNDNAEVGGGSARTHSPKLASLANADAGDLTGQDELYDAARAMLERWDEARSLRSQYNAMVAAEDAGGAGFDARARMEHVGRVHVAVSATVDAFDEFMQLVAQGPDEDAVAGESLLGLYSELVEPPSSSPPR